MDLIYIMENLKKNKQIIFIRISVRHSVICEIESTITKNNAAVIRGRLNLGSFVRFYSDYSYSVRPANK